MGDDVDTDGNGREESDEDEQARAGAEAVFADEDLAESRRRHGCDWFGECHRCVEIQWPSSRGKSLP